ncbi:MAG: hypothetical protein Kapaf2KO_03520 [Candidatus Kapaibacteriales bacterium]
MKTTKLYSLYNMFTGGNMLRFIRVSILLAVLTMVGYQGSIADNVFVSGRVAPGDVRIFTKDNTYYIQKSYTVGGTLIIEPGTNVIFNPNGRLIDSVGGRIIADGGAVATYNQNPDGINPISANPAINNGFSGYADLDYFTYSGTQSTIDVQTVRDLTINPAKNNILNSVILDKANRRILDYNPEQGRVPVGPNQELISFEQAIVFENARLSRDPQQDINLNINPWVNKAGLNPSVVSATIEFEGEPVNNFSREWGHIIILPGSRGAFFRNARFKNFVKDTTVDNTPFYTTQSFPTLSQAQVNTLNRNVNLITNGSGAAITTFSSRTWLLNCSFEDNQARLRGGAVQFLETPPGFPTTFTDDEDLINTYGAYAANKNPNVTEPTGIPSLVNFRNYNGNNIPAIPAIDLFDEAAPEPLTDNARQAWDDGRLAIYLGRVRNLTFEDNAVQLAKVGEVRVGGVPFVTDITDTPTPYPNTFGNGALGGAVYLSGRNDDNATRMEVGLGINNSINTTAGTQNFPALDQFMATGNEARNYQSSMQSLGARGGAVYVGDYTSLIVGGEFTNNKAEAPFMENDGRGSNIGNFSMGGAIYTANTLGRLQIRGGAARDALNNATMFSGNIAGNGGAVFVDGNTSTLVSPVIGGSDQTQNTRDYGFNIEFQNNTAKGFGGAVYARRNPRIHGAGGVELNQLIGYGGNYPVKFMNNKAGYAGGAIDIEIPNAEVLPDIRKRVSIIRAQFEGNEVGQTVSELDNKRQIRGGGAIYSVSGLLNVVKATQFIDNKVWNGNGGAISIVAPQINERRFFLSDLDVLIDNDGDGIDETFTSTDHVFTFNRDLDNDQIDDILYPADQRMLTRFFGNEVYTDNDVLADQSGNGTSQVGNGRLATTQDLIATYWITSSTGFAVGYNGTIVKFTQGGGTWEYPSSGTADRLTDVFFTTNNNGFIVGSNGTMLSTTDGGDTWNMVTLPADNDSQPLPTAKKINDINFLGNNNGYAVTDDGYLLWTSNGGATWSIQQVITDDLHTVQFLTTQVGYVAGENGRVLRTDDGGNTWNNVSPTTGDNINSMFFFSAQRGVVVGNSGLITRTDDGGQTWTTTLPRVTNYDLTSIKFESGQLGYASGNTATILRTNDGGATWTALNTGTPNNSSLYDVFTTSANTVYAVGDFGAVIVSNDAGQTFSQVLPTQQSIVDFPRYNLDRGLPENGVGLGGALYILDEVSDSRINRTDSITFNRVRMQENMAYTGAAIYSDNYDLKLVFNRSLITGNKATSEIGMMQNVVEGPITRDANGNIELNEASSDLAGAVIYGEIQGPLPSNIYSEAANSIYDNEGRFLIRLPDGPNTKGVLAGTNAGIGGTDTLRGNYWGHTEADIIVEITNSKATRSFETFFKDENGQTWLPFQHTPSIPKEQGPYEDIHYTVYNKTYNPIPLNNGATQNDVDVVNSIPENLLMSGGVYDLFDKGTDIKLADYTNRRMVPIEDFAVGIAPNIKRYTDATMPSNGKYVKRLIRNPFAIEAIDQNTSSPLYPTLQRFAQLEFQESTTQPGNFYHPIGYPLYLQTEVDYSGITEVSNHDPSVMNESVFFVVNETTGDYIRTTFDQVSEVAPFRETFRARVDIVPDSTLRNPNTTIRRTIENLFNLRSGRDLLAQLRFEPGVEDSAALGGRRYDVPYVQGSNDNTLGATNDLLRNRPSMPASNNGLVTYFAGEKYQALPVNVGDNVRIFSRTVLWNEGVAAAFNDGMAFTIERSTEPPVFTGDVVVLSDSMPTEARPSETNPNVIEVVQIPELQNTVHIQEDRSYPGNYTNGRNRIANISARDTNQFFDIRALADPDNFPLLEYDVSVDPNSGLNRWMVTDIMNLSESQNNANFLLRGGYALLRGRPTNPYVVPGGEEVEVSVSNFPPNSRLIDLLKQQGNLSDEEISQYIELFNEYLSNMTYSETDARFLQQDTIFIGSNFTTDYRFKIFVIDSLPQYLDENYTANTIERVDKDGNVLNVLANYEPSDIGCGKTDEGALIANMTNKLRFQIDINTDDELEDAAAEGNWDFRYGRTAYGFRNIHRTGDGDLIVIDTTLVPNGQGGRDSIVYQSRPSWLADDYWKVYDSDTQDDLLGGDFTSNGQLNIRIDSLEAVGLLRRTGTGFEDWAVDSTFTVVVNDGHGGQNTISFPIHVNVQPELLDVTLPNAIEDQDYNRQLLNEARRIRVEDKNDDEYHQFFLIRNGVAVGYTGPLDTDGNPFIDPCFEEAGVHDIANADVPEWLKINRESGLLYGTPGVKDAPNTFDVAVLVVDQYGLTAYRTYPLTVDPVNHIPDLTNAPLIGCVELGEDWEEEFELTDIDIARILGAPGSNDILDLVVVQPATGFELDPNRVESNGVDTTVTITIKTTNGFNVSAADIVNGKVNFVIRVTDRAGETDELRFAVKVSEETRFTSDITIQNSNGEEELLTWGMADNATTGDDRDGQGFGTLDSDTYCENEIPAFTPQSVFDARWSIPSTEGVLRNIFPTTPNASVLEYIGRFQPGGEIGDVNKYFPIRFTWNTNTIPAQGDAQANPNGSQWVLRDAGSDGRVFSVNMKDPINDQVLSPGAILQDNGNGEVTLVLNNPSVTDFKIVFDVASSVEENGIIVANGIENIYPNPATTSTTVKYGLISTASVQFEITDMMGKTIIVDDLGTVGAGMNEHSLNVMSTTGAKLAAGVYNLRMIVDGKQVSVQQLPVAQ